MEGPRSRALAILQAGDFRAGFQERSQHEQGRGSARTLRQRRRVPVDAAAPGHVSPQTGRLVRRQINDRSTWSVCHGDVKRLPWGGRKGSWSLTPILGAGLSNHPGNTQTGSHGSLVSERGRVRR